MDDLIKEYRITRSNLMGAKLRASVEDQQLISSMLSDVQLTIEWLQKGHDPGPRRGIHRRSGRQRTVTVDPLHMQSYAQPAACGSPTTLSDHERFQIDDALSTLSEREKQCYILKYGLCYSLGQIALELDVKKGTVQDYLKNAERKIVESKMTSLFLVG